MPTAIWLVPALGGAVVAFLRPPLAKAVAVLVAALSLALTLALAVAFDPGRHAFQFAEAVPWVGAYHVQYHVGVDGLSLWLLVLNALLSLVAVVATPPETVGQPRFLGLLLVMEAGMAGVFVSLDLVLFYVFWEAMLIPAYFLLWGWGDASRPAAAFKFVLYTLVGSLLMLVGIIAEYYFTGQKTFEIGRLAAMHPGESAQFGLFILFALAFAVKIPLFPFHSWLPDAYLSAPTPVLVTLAGVMGKTGAYGFLRIVLPLFPHPAWGWDWNWVFAALAVASIIWGAFLALAQTDMKALVAYSSISHMGFVVLGIFSLTTIGAEGAVVQMVNHGLIIAALFLIVDWVAGRVGTRDRRRLGGLGLRMPILAAVFMVITLAALGLPGLNSFVGEFMTLLGAWQLAPVLALLACVGLILAPVYMLRMFQGVFQGPPVGEPARVIDLRPGEGALVTPLVALMFVLGLYPYLITQALAAVGQAVPWR